VSVLKKDITFAVRLFFRGLGGEKPFF